MLGGFLLFKRWVAVLVAAAFFFLAFLIVLQQEEMIGVWFQTSDLHHETFALSAMALGLGVLIGSAITETNKR